MNLKKFLICAVTASILASVPCVSASADSTINQTERHLSQRSYEPQRFVKLTMDDNYEYYLDRESVRWVRVPYTSSEYMADVWIRMIERFPEDDPDRDMDAYQYFDPNEIGEVMVAQEQNVRYSPVDLEVLRRKEYFLEHYYLRPKTKQIQFLCELEVVGHPQNNAEGREYSYKNWENLIPGSIESILYKAVLKKIGTSMADADGHQTFADYFEEITRISIR